MTSHNVTIGLVLTCVHLFGCSSSEPGATSASDSNRPGPSERVDSGRTVLSGPTLIAFYPLGTAGEEPSADLSAALDDFSQHLSAASPNLRALGFHVETQAV